MKRFKKILKWTVVILGALVAVALIANAAFVWTTDARLERQLAAIREAGDPLTLADLQPKPIPPESNAATYLRQAEKDVDAIHKEIGQWIETEKQTELYQYFSEKQPMPDKMRKAMNAIFAAHPNVIGLLQKAVECPDYDAQPDYAHRPEDLIAEMLPIVQNLRPAARILSYRSRPLAIDGNGEEAARMSLALFQLGRHADRNPTLVGYLVALTIRGLAVDSANWALQAAGPVSKEVGQALDAELAAQDPMAGYVWTIKTERACGLDHFRRSIPLRNFWIYNRGYWNQEESEFLDMMNAFLVLPSDSDPLYHIKQTIHKANGTFSPDTGPFAQRFFPSLDATYNAVMRVRALIRCLRVLNALQTHVPTDSDTVPKLADLGLPAETTLDPYTYHNRKPLHVKKLPQGWLVYSVGPNGQDDGGNFEHPMIGDIGVGPPSLQKTAEPPKK
jgi:hypothetical protein